MHDANKYLVEGAWSTGKVSRERFDTEDEARHFLASLQFGVLYRGAEEIARKPTSHEACGGQIKDAPY
jgi:hypothetical protein